MAKKKNSNTKATTVVTSEKEQKKVNEIFFNFVVFQRQILTTAFLSHPFEVISFLRFNPLRILSNIFQESFPLKNVKFLDYFRPVLGENVNNDNYKVESFPIMYEGHKLWGEFIGWPLMNSSSQILLTLFLMSADSSNAGVFELDIERTPEGSFLTLFNAAPDAKNVVKITPISERQPVEAGDTISFDYLQFIVNPSVKYFVENLKPETSNSNTEVDSDPNTIVYTIQN